MGDSRKRGQGLPADSGSWEPMLHKVYALRVHRFRNEWYFHLVSANLLQHVMIFENYILGLCQDKNRYFSFWHFRLDEVL